MASKATEALDEGFESVMTVMVLPKSYRRFHRTSNHIERLIRELKRRSTVIGVFLNKDTVLRVIGSVLMEQHTLFSARPKLTYLKNDTKKLEESYPQLKEIANEQQKLLAA